MKPRIVLLLAFFGIPIAQAGEMPCVKAEKELLRYMSYLNARNEKDFSACIRSYRVCLLTFGGEVLKAQTIRSVRDPGEFDSVTLGIVQTPANEEVTLCLVGAYSGGSAAAWTFDGWQTRNDTTVKLENMSKGRLNSDAVPARTLANIIYDVYDKFGKAPSAEQGGVPTFEGTVGAPSVPRDDPTAGGRFNEFMDDNDGKVVYLFIFLDDDQRADFERAPDELNRISFSVRDDYSTGSSAGNEYLIHLPADRKNYHFEYLQGVGRLSGYFKIWNINGPRQGWMSVNLRPVEKPN